MSKTHLLVLLTSLTTACADVGHLREAEPGTPVPIGPIRHAEGALIAATLLGGDVPATAGAAPITHGGDRVALAWLRQAQDDRLCHLGLAMPGASEVRFSPEETALALLLLRPGLATAVPEAVDALAGALPSLPEFRTLSAHLRRSDAGCPGIPDDIETSVSAVLAALARAPEFAPRPGFAEKRGEIIGCRVAPRGEQDGLTLVPQNDPPRATCPIRLLNTKGRHIALYARPQGAADFQPVAKVGPATFAPTVGQIAEDVLESLFGEARRLLGGTESSFDLPGAGADRWEIRAYGPGLGGGTLDHEDLPRLIEPTLLTFSDTLLGPVLELLIGARLTAEHWGALADLALIPALEVDAIARGYGERGELAGVAADWLLAALEGIISTPAGRAWLARFGGGRVIQALVRILWRYQATAGLYQAITTSLQLLVLQPRSDFTVEALRRAEEEEPPPRPAPEDRPEQAEPAREAPPRDLSCRVIDQDPNTPEATLHLSSPPHPMRLRWRFEGLSAGDVVAYRTFNARGGFEDSPFYVEGAWLGRDSITSERVPGCAACDLDLRFPARTPPAGGWSLRVRPTVNGVVMGCEASWFITSPPEQLSVPGRDFDRGASTGRARRVGGSVKLLSHGRASFHAEVPDYAVRMPGNRPVPWRVLARVRNEGGRHPGHIMGVRIRVDGRVVGLTHDLPLTGRAQTQEFGDVELVPGSHSIEVEWVDGPSHEIDGEGDINFYVQEVRLVSRP